MRIDFFEKSRPLVLFMVLLFVTMMACGTSVDSAGGDAQRLIEILTNPDESPQNRREAAAALGDLGDPAAVEPLLLTLGECDKTEGAWCQNVIEALGKLGDSRAVEPLIGSLDHATYKNNILRALNELGDPGAIVPLIQTVYMETLNTKKDFRSEDKTMRSYDDLSITVDSLASRSGSQAFKPIKDALPQFDVDPPEIEELNSLEARCLKYRLGISALLATQDPDIEAVLGSELDAKRNCDWLLPHAFAKFYNYEAEKLLPFLKTENVVTASQFVRILIHIGYPGTEEAMILVLNNCSEELAKYDLDLFCANSIAAEFYYSKNAKLSEAAGQWALEHDYDFSLVGPGYGEYSGPIWNDLDFDPYFK